MNCPGGKKSLVIVHFEVCAKHTTKKVGFWSLQVDQVLDGRRVWLKNDKTRDVVGVWDRRQQLVGVNTTLDELPINTLTEQLLPQLIWDASVRDGHSYDHNSPGMLQYGMDTATTTTHLGYFSLVQYVMDTQTQLLQQIT